MLFLLISIILEGNHSTNFYNLQLRAKTIRGLEWNIICIICLKPRHLNHGTFYHTVVMNCVCRGPRTQTESQAIRTLAGNKMVKTTATEKQQATGRTHYCTSKPGSDNGGVRSRKQGQLWGT